MAPGREYVPPYLTALVYVKLGDTRTTIAWLQKAVEQKDPMLGNIKVDPMLDPIRSNPVYVRLVREADLSD